MNILLQGDEGGGALIALRKKVLRDIRTWG